MQLRSLSSSSGMLLRMSSCFCYSIIHHQEALRGTCNFRVLIPLKPSLSSCTLLLHQMFPWPSYLVLLLDQHIVFLLYSLVFKKTSKFWVVLNRLWLFFKCSFHHHLFKIKILLNLAQSVHKLMSSNITKYNSILIRKPEECA